MSMTCHHCGTVWDGDRKIGREAACRQCSSPLHCCLNCRFYDKTKHNQCAEPAAEWVRDKKMGNFCEYFEWRTAGTASKDDERKKKVEDALKNLFKD